MLLLRRRSKRLGRRRRAVGAARALVRPLRVRPTSQRTRIRPEGYIERVRYTGDQRTEGDPGAGPRARALLLRRERRETRSRGLQSL